MHETINIIGDIAGRYDELMELLGKMPAASLTLSVGDLVDRGPQSRQVIEWFMGDPLSREAVFANHELMMLAACTYWSHEPLRGHPYWYRNGGTQTMESYHYAPPPAEHLRWLQNRPAWYKQDGLFVSHAPVYDVNDIPPQYGYDWKEWAERADHGDESSWVWNRYITRKPMPGHFMVYGHNSRFCEHQYVDEAGAMHHYATCIDNSRGGRELMGMHWPSKETFAVEYHT